MIARFVAPLSYIVLLAAAYVAGLYLHVLFIGIDWGDLGLGPKACRSDNVYLDAFIEAARSFVLIALPMLVPTALALWYRRRIGHRIYWGLPFAPLALTMVSAFAVDLARDLEFVRLCEAGAFSTMAGEAEGGKPLFVEWPELPAWMDAITVIPSYVLLTVVLAVLFVALRLSRPPLAPDDGAP